MPVQQVELGGWFRVLHELREFRRSEYEGTQGLLIE